jgi:hypothetical protein
VRGGGEVGDEQLTRLRLARPALPAHGDGLVDADHSLQGVPRDAVHVSLPLVVRQGVVVVDIVQERDAPVRVQTDDQGLYLGVDAALPQPLADDIQHGRLVKVVDSGKVRLRLVMREVVATYLLPAHLCVGAGGAHARHHAE